ncbi:DUF2637 domain-containing protein [Streptomyces sp. NPDC017964]|uniref:DUF2637 domain-containing protein n=1 Tax=Streptomyces sp. NPDC017964 TaxID=3365022 RepID=UPI0037A15E0F
MDLMTSGQWLLDHWQLSAGVAVSALAPPLIGRALRRADTQSKDLAGMDEAARAERARVRDRRGRRVEDVLTLVVAAAAAYLSSTGLRKFGRDIMNLSAPWDWLPFVGLDLAALVCGLRARRRARKGDGSGLSGSLFWVLIAISALFSASEAQDLMGSVARAAWPLISGVLFELGSLEERLAAREQLKRNLGLWLERKVAAIRLLHPIEWVRVQLALAANEKISQDDATRQVRIERAGYWLYRLRRLQEREARPKGKRGRLLVLPGQRTAWVDRRAQSAQARVTIHDYRLVLGAVQLRVRTREFATLNFNNATAAERALDNLIGSRFASIGTTGTERHTGTQGPDRTGTHSSAPERSSTEQHDDPARTGTDTERSGTEQHGVPTRTGTGDSTPAHTADVPVRRSDADVDRTGTPGETYRPRTGTGWNGRSAQLAPGMAQETGTANLHSGTPAPLEQHDRASEDADPRRDAERSNEELVRALRENLNPDGTFSTGGIGKTCEHFGIGTSRAIRLRDEARTLGPLGTAAQPASLEQHDPESAVPSAEEALANEKRWAAAEVEERAVAMEDAIKEQSVRKVARMALEVGACPDGDLSSVTSSLATALPLTTIQDELQVSEGTANEYRQEAAALLQGGYRKELMTSAN